MFAANIYRQRRDHLRGQFKSGLALFMGNRLLPMNYTDNVFPFRQDGSFLYYWGLAQPDLAALIDFDSGEEYLIGDAQSMQEIIFCGQQPALLACAEKIACVEVMSWSAAWELLSHAQAAGRLIHYLPQYQSDNVLRMQKHLLLEQQPLLPSRELVSAVIAQRMIKAPEEIEEIKHAVDLSEANHLQAMKMSRPGMVERDVVAQMEAFAMSKQSSFAYPIIFSVRGEVLHNNTYDNRMNDGQLLLHDSGLCSQNFYASDITRTFPVGGTFTAQQRAIYQLVYDMQQTVFARLAAGVSYRDCHLEAARCAVEGLKSLGLMKGDVDAAVAEGAYGLFFPHGLGHQLGLDVHDMEGLGESEVGYQDDAPRSEQFGLCFLRFARPLQQGMVITVEPGLYFIPPLIDEWRQGGLFKDFICYDKLEAYYDFGGVRIEDNVLISKDGYENLSAKIPSEIEAVVKVCAGS